jgi:hypothetical protein
MEDFRNCAPTGSLLASTFALSLISGLAHAADATPDLSGVYWATEYIEKIAVLGGGELPLTDAGRAAYEANIAGLADGSVTDAARKFCTPEGPVRALATPYPFEIVQSPPGQVLMLHELSHQIRVIQLDQPLLSFDDVVAYPWHNGHSVGHWEGNTLIVETIGFNVFTFLDATGAPHTDQLVTTERWRKTSPDELEVMITVDDPEFYTEEWQTRFVYVLRNDVRIEDYVCGLKHRDISAIPGVTEAREAQP